jgi:hypothetical protein
MLKKLALLIFLILCSIVLILFDMQKEDKNRAFDKGTAVWHE